MKIKNWDKYQAYKPRNSKGHRKMSWFRVYPTLLNDKEYMELDDESKALLLELWCLASEKSGFLIEIEHMAFRLRRTPQFLDKTIKKLSKFIDMDAVDNEEQVLNVENDSRDFAKWK